MTAEEVRNRICLHGETMTEDEALVILNALEKQIPKKPIGDLHSVPHHRCPSCFSAIRIFVDDKYDVCCKFCGQAIDWRNDNDD